MIPLFSSPSSASSSLSSSFSCGLKQRKTPSNPHLRFDSALLLKKEILLTLQHLQFCPFSSTLTAAQYFCRKPMLLPRQGQSQSLCQLELLFLEKPAGEKKEILIVKSFQDSGEQKKKRQVIPPLCFDLVLCSGWLLLVCWWP